MLEAINDVANARSDQANLVASRLSKSHEPKNGGFRPGQQGETKAEETSQKATEVSQDLLDALEREIGSMHQVGLRFAKHDGTGRTVIRVINKDTKELIREIPPEKVLDLAARLSDMIGILFYEIA